MDTPVSMHARRARCIGVWRLYPRAVSACLFFWLFLACVSVPCTAMSSAPRERMARSGLDRQVRENSLLFIIARIETSNGVLTQHLSHSSLYSVLLRCCLSPGQLSVKLPARTRSYLLPVETRCAGEHLPYSEKRHLHEHLPLTPFHYTRIEETMAHKALRYIIIPCQLLSHVHQDPPTHIPIYALLADLWLQKAPYPSPH